MSKRTLDSFFSPTASKKLKKSEDAPETVEDASQTFSSHPTYPFPVPALPKVIAGALPDTPVKSPRHIVDQPDLDLLYFEPYFSPKVSKELFEFLRRELFFYRVQYKIKRYGKETEVNTPRL